RGRGRCRRPDPAPPRRPAPPCSRLRRAAPERRGRPAVHRPRTDHRPVSTHSRRPYRRTREDPHMLIMIGADTYPPVVSRAGRFTRRLAEGLLRRGHEVHLICPSVTGRPETEQVAGVTVHRLTSHPCLVHERLRICLPAQI